jgi:hypothetical protein
MVYAAMRFGDCGYKDRDLEVGGFLTPGLPSTNGR